MYPVSVPTVSGGISTVSGGISTVSGECHTDFATVLRFCILNQRLTVIWYVTFQFYPAFSAIDTYRRNSASFLVCFILLIAFIK